MMNLNPLGQCPKCGNCDGYVNVGKDHWGVCQEHKIKWFIGHDLFDDWKEQTQAQWDEHARELAEYEDVTKHPE